MTIKNLCMIVGLLVFCSAVNALPADEAGSEAAVQNRQNMMQLQDLKIEQNYIRTVPEDLDNQKKIQEQEQRQLQEILKENTKYNQQLRPNTEF